MPGYRVNEVNPSPEKKTGSARTSKKSKRRNVIRYVDWSGEQQSVNSSPTGPQQQPQDVDDGAGASPESAGEAMVLVAPEKTVPGTSPSLDHQIMDSSPDDYETAPEPLSPLDHQDKDATPPDSEFPITSEHMEGNYEVQRAQEEQKADDWPSENMRPNAQNLRYGGYPAQPAPQNRNTPLGSGRLQNTTKLGT